MRRPACLTMILSVAVGLLAVAPASAALRVGIAEQSPNVFDDPFFQLAKPKVTRLIFPFDTISDAGPDLAAADAFFAKAEQAGIEVLVSFNPTREHDVTRYGTTKDLPSVSAFTSFFKAFRARYPKQKVISPWNEINHNSQPTFAYPTKKRKVKVNGAKRAAQFANVVHKLCKGCKVVAGDFIVQGGMASYYKQFKKHLKFRPKYWGLHNYPDVNRFRPGGTKEFLKLTKRGEVWLTETGGLAQFCPSTCIFPYNEKRQAKAIDYMFKLTKLNKKRLTRLYIYKLYGEPRTARFDAGLMGPDGKPRAAYCRTVLRTHKAGYNALRAGKAC